MSTVHVHERRDPALIKRFSPLTIVIAVVITLSAISFIGWSMLYNEPTVQTLDKVAPLDPPLGTP